MVTHFEKTRLQNILKDLEQQQVNFAAVFPQPDELLARDVTTCLGDLADRGIRMIETIKLLRETIDDLEISDAP